MAISESQLATWSKPGSQVQSQNTYQIIRNTLDDPAAPYHKWKYRISLQGSYGNDTNIYSDSDVDIAICLTSVHYYDTSSLSEDDLKKFENESIDLVLFDPPYSPRQVSECYKKLGKTVNMETTQASFWSNMKKEIARITKPNGLVLCFGWNSQGIGKTRGFQMEEILLVAHGGHHNDTICTMERKAQTLFSPCV